ncbi:hypothetical protein OJF2_71270 [Aquisphaera giovannonii]|uniref:ABC-type transport auxiliary lipoprotein component domain-containing protein n=1 Tax=Aquisphaera giovannonii TaxID=406548 RepID=A0A5B9WE93_9BACT|nr:hypothetical protein [Aquisphaera giovannonii]QEH38524.1 hypothetical protein OJF2_71270 [Aquisphaera giovannonii]
MRTTQVAAASLLGLAAAVIGQAGCSSMSALHAPGLSRILSPRPVAENPLAVPINDFEAVWKKAVEVTDRYFDIDQEDRLAHTIVTQPKIGATLLEPWSSDSVSFTDRLESTLQTIRRFAIIKVEPAQAGGYLVRVEVRKQLEDMVKPDRAAAGRAVFNNDFPVNRTHEIVGPVPVPLGWIDRGRDANLEQAILAGIRDALFL